MNNNQQGDLNKLSKTTNQLQKSGKFSKQLDPLDSKSKESIGRQTHFASFGGQSQIIGSKIAKLQEQGNFFAKKIENENNKLTQLETDIKKIQEEIEEKRLLIIDNKRTRSDNDPEFLQSKIKANYVKIDALKKKINEQIAANNSIKEQINELRREKNIYDKIYEELQVELQEKKRRLRQILVESKNAREEISLGKQRLERFQMEAQIDKKQFEEEINSVFQIIDLENREDKMKQNFDNAAENRNKNKQQNDSYQNNFSSFGGFITQPELGDNISQNKKKKIQKEREKRLLQKDMNNMEQLKQEVNHYEEVFQKLKEETGTEDMDLIVKKLVDCEEENFSLFKYINALRDEQEQLINQEKQIQQDIDQINQNYEQEMQDPKTQKIFEIQKEIDTINHKKQKFLENQQEMQQTMNELKTMLPVIYERIGCNNEMYSQELGFDPKNIEEMNEQNILQFLSVIEKRTQDLILIYNSKFNNNLNQNKTDIQEKNANRLQSKQSNQRRNEDLDFVLDSLKEETSKPQTEKQKEDKKNKDLQIFEVNEKDLLDGKSLRLNAKQDIMKIYGIAQKQKVNSKKKGVITNVNNNLDK